MDLKNLENLAKLVRYYILVSTTEAGSGHPTSSMSATDVMVTLMFGGFFKADLNNPNYENNDRLIFSKGHASPLFYSLYAAAGKVSEEELKTLRKFGSRLEGHPTMEFPYTEAATGSLGQGLSIGVGMALNAKLEKLDYKTFVLMGDSEVAEGSVWEAMEIATHYKLDNLIGIVDVNRLGQRGETLLGHDIGTYKKRFEAFGAKVWEIDGHNLKETKWVFEQIEKDKSSAPKIIIARTLKGKGVSFLEDKDGWHGKAVPADKLDEVLKEIGEVEKIVGKVEMPNKIKGASKKTGSRIKSGMTEYKLGEMVATRKAYGNILAKLAGSNSEVVALDAETSNSTMSESVKKENPEKFFEMYIAEQNMVGAALGFSRRGKIPFASTFAAFFSRAFDQIRMSQFANPNVKFVGSHAGVSIGEDGASQMALEDLASFRTLHGGVVLYPSDAVSAEKLIAIAAEHLGNVYIRTTRAETPILYKADEEFKIGGFKVHKQSLPGKPGKGKASKVVVIGAGITLHEALKAQLELAKEKIGIDVVDLYSIKPIDESLRKVVKGMKVITVEDHYPEGGIGEAVRSVIDEKVNSLAVRKMPRSGKPAELLRYEEIDSAAIISLVRKLIKD